MKIVGIETHVLTGRLEGKAFGWSQRVTGTRQTALCVISTDAGIEGLGEAFYFGGPATVVATLMHDGLGPLLVGSDPTETSLMWDRLYNWTRDQGQKGLTISALSAIDIALWDIKGRSLGVPVYTLLGGAYRKRARVYATGLYEPQGVPSVPAALVEEALGYRRAGFCGMKLKIGYDLRTDLSYVQAIREAIGPDLLLMVDANHAYNASEAIRLARAMEPYDIHWFEEPVPPEELDGYLEIKRHSKIPLAAGECEYTRYGFRELINRRVVDTKTTTISRYAPDVPGGPWVELAKLDHRYAGRTLELAVPRKLLGLLGDAFSFDFHWCDNPISSLHSVAW